ncbi:heme-dependent oxidative N-demethylase family protein [Candidatus Entotheonella palauensis]|uniref:DUF3445 domain-containing protein n=1 Tax=Candidatus Entotheonella gemina TaxID=1429439 RepID=W4M8Q1_9BACT|nr:DUF3445 domain-containing protein [Candidatus Entotheonella palauensis]ETX06012.1 MAG: hypothetical protein ETSY2_19655 [Candidatus Entotheonella gemina]
MRDYAPYMAKTSGRLAMALVPLDPKDWIEPDEHFTADLAEKDRLLAERCSEVFIVLPEAKPGSEEVLELLADYLPAQFPNLYERQGDQLSNQASGRTWNLACSTLHPLDLAGRLVQEDLCLMQLEPESGHYRLVGASVCFPTRWCLADKIGDTVGPIHAPVPGYEAQLSSTMDRFFARLKTERPVWRVNWSIVDDPALFLPKGHGRRERDHGVTADNAGEKLWLRMERQTLRRLPRTRDVLFTIRIYVHPLHTLTAHPERAAALATAIRSLPPELQTYKSVSPFREAILAWLDRYGAASG